MPEITGRRTLYEGTLLRLEEVTVRYPDIERGREVVSKVPAVAIVALHEQTDVVAHGYQVTLVRQFRVPLGRELLEIVAGHIDEGESPLEAAQRELREETGWVGESWVELGQIYASPGFTDELITLFLVRRLRQVGAEPDAGEHLAISQVPLTLALGDIREGRIQDAKSVAGLLWTALYLEREQAQGSAPA